MFADAHTDDFFALMRNKVTSLIRRVRGSPNNLVHVVAGRQDSAVLGRFTELHAPSGSTYTSVNQLSLNLGNLICRNINIYY